MGTICKKITVIQLAAQDDLLPDQQLLERLESREEKQPDLSQKNVGEKAISEISPIPLLKKNSSELLQEQRRLNRSENLKHLLYLYNKLQI